MKRAVIFFLLGAAIFGLGCSIGSRRDQASIEASLLKLTPLGSSPEAVLEAVKNEGWRTIGYIDRAGFYKQHSAKPEIVGVSHIRASLGDYPAFPLGTTNTTAFWGFDKDRRLIQIWVWKTTDTL